MKTFSSKLGEDGGFLEEGINQVQEENSQEAVPNSMALPGLRMCAHCIGTRVPMHVGGRTEAEPPSYR